MSLYYDISSTYNRPLSKLAPREGELAENRSANLTEKILYRQDLVF